MQGAIVEAQKEQVLLNPNYGTDIKVSRNAPYIHLAVVSNHAVCPQGIECLLTTSRLAVATMNTVPHPASLAPSVTSLTPTFVITKPEDEDKICQLTKGIEKCTIFFGNTTGLSIMEYQPDFILTKCDFTDAFKSIINMKVE